MAKKMMDMVDDKIGTEVLVKVFGNDFTGGRTNGTYKTYIGTLYTTNKGAETMTILSPKGKGYRVIQAHPSNVRKCQRQRGVKFQKAA